MNSNNSFHLPGLDSLRALAACAVIIGHIEIFKAKENLPNMLSYFSFQGNLIGHLGVILFFVLSGFLITLLMFREMDLTNNINIKSFYKRRIRRICPLYFGVLIVSAVCTYFIPSITTFLLCVTFLPNIAQVIGEGWKPSPQIWSIGVEQQFYFFWPFFILLFKRKILVSLIIFFIVYSLLPHFLQWFFIHCQHTDKTELVNYLFIVFGMKFNCMALGGVMAYIFHFGVREKYKSSTIFKIVSYIAPLFWFGNFNLPYFNDEFYALLFGILILGISIKSIDNMVLRNRITNHLGKISYGLYMYHWLILLLVAPLVKNLIKNNFIWGNIAFYLIIFALTVFISHASYTLFEKKFLKSKEVLP